MLDGRIWRIDLDALPTTPAMGDFRAACYRNADKRQRAVVTKQTAVRGLLIQAYTNGPPLLSRGIHGLETLPLPAPSLATEADDDFIAAMEAKCTCGQSPRHAPTCAVWG